MSSNFNLNNPLRRSVTNRYIGGVCGGIADAYDIDSTFVRLLFILLTVAGMSGVLVYLILWFVMPEEGADRAGF